MTTEGKNMESLPEPPTNATYVEPSAETILARISDLTVVLLRIRVVVTR
jgi:hypothetical protein